MENKNFKLKCLGIRKDIIHTISKSKRGHVGSAFSLVEILVSIYFYILKHNPKDTKWGNRDRFILSKGHGCLALYCVLSECNYFEKKRLEDFCKPNGSLGGHPKRGDVPGIEASTGSLGQGISIAVGMALALKLSNNKSRVFVVLGDGECNEGSVWEAALSAAKNNLTNLNVIIDYNKLQSYGEVKDVCPLEPFDKKWESFGFDVQTIDLVNDPTGLIKYYSTRKESNNPQAIICHTIKGQGNRITENNLEWHHKNSITEDEIKLLYKGLI